jgi:phospholipase/carboxylesterase
MNPVVLAVGVRPAAKHLNEFIDEQLLKYDLPPTAYALMGFSQGAVTVLFAGLRRTHAPRVILSFSGGLLAPETLKSEMKNHAPVLLWHGEIDRVIPAVHSKNAAAQLRAANVPVEMVFAPKLGHGVNPAMLQPAASSLQRAFKEKSLT